MNELLATYYIEHKGVTRRKFHVRGCWDKDTPENEFDFFDIDEEVNGVSQCINEGAPFYEMPTREEVKEFIKANEI